MQHVRYVERLNARYRAQGFPPYQWTVHRDAPLTPLAKPLRECRVSLLTSGGVSHCAMPAWNPDARNDFRLDTIASDAAAPDFQVHDSYYDVASAREDVNCVFPLERLRELARENVIGDVAPHHYSGFMGRIYKRSHVSEVAAPELADALSREHVDLFLLVPA
jgi:D-proline reductase (dithiol) PrdB